jgi:hypothetical protein
LRRLSRPRMLVGMQFWIAVALIIGAILVVAVIFDT